MNIFQNVGCSQTIFRDFFLKCSNFLFHWPPGSHDALSVPFWLHSSEQRSGDWQVLNVTAERVGFTRPVQRGWAVVSWCLRQVTAKQIHTGLWWLKKEWCRPCLAHKHALISVLDFSVCCFQSCYFFCVFVFLVGLERRCHFQMCDELVHHSLALNDFMTTPAMVIKFILCWHCPASFGWIQKIKEHPHSFPVRLCIEAELI